MEIQTHARQAFPKSDPTTRPPRIPPQHFEHALQSCMYQGAYHTSSSSSSSAMYNTSTCICQRRVCVCIWRRDVCAGYTHINDVRIYVSPARAGGLAFRSHILLARGARLRVSVVLVTAAAVVARRPSPVARRRRRRPVRRRRLRRSAKRELNKMAERSVT